jgi:5-(carboxyamino)imidazole ribonucleotide synthase
MSLTSHNKPPHPAKTLGILGGGQLGRMSALAAARLGIQVHIFTPEKDSPASQIAAKTIVADYSDKKALKDFTKGVDVISYEFENIPVSTVRYLQKIKPVFPDDRLLEISQHRWQEKSFLNEIGIPTAKWAKARKPQDVIKTLQEWGATSCILKTTRFGYDGKGQAKFSAGQDLDAAWKSLKSDEIIIEQLIDFDCEISCIIARDRFGKTAIYDPVLNEHKNHILSKTTAPAPLPAPILKKAMSWVKKLANRVDLVGVLALELFVTKDGKLLANEIAPRTHNSGHWTIDACAVSQFENHVRTVCGLPASPAERHSDAVMLNLIGEDIALVDKYVDKKNACIHLYGKNEVRTGRKMGHITLLKPTNPL